MYLGYLEFGYFFYHFISISDPPDRRFNGWYVMKLYKVSEYKIYSIMLRC